MIFKQFLAFWIKNLFFLACHKNLWPKGVFCHFLKKKSIFGKRWYQKWILWLISIQKMYIFIYITVVVWELQHSICFKKNGFTPLKTLLHAGLLIIKRLLLTNQVREFTLGHDKRNYLSSLKCLRAFAVSLFHSVIMVMDLKLSLHGILSE